MGGSQGSYGGQGDHMATKVWDRQSLIIVEMGGSYSWIRSRITVVNCSWPKNKQYIKSHRRISERREYPLISPKGGA